MSIEMKRAGVYLPSSTFELLDSYARVRGKSRNTALNELLMRVLVPELAEVRPEVVDQAIKQVQSEHEVSDGKW